MTQRVKMITATAVVVLVMAPPMAHAQLLGIPGVPDIVWDPTSVAEITKDIEAVMKLYQLEQEAAAFLANPGDWRNDMSIALTATDAAIQTHTANTLAVDPSTDIQKLERLDKVITASQRALRQSVMIGGNLRTQDAASLAILSLQQVEALRQRDGEARRIQQIADVKRKSRSAGDWGCVSCSLGARQR